MTRAALGSRALASRNLVAGSSCLPRSREELTMTKWVYSFGAERAEGRGEMKICSAAKARTCTK